MKHLKLVCCTVALALLAGCAVEPPAPNIAREQGDWSQQHQRLADLTDWQLAGKIAFRSPNQNRSANLDWHQNNQHYVITVSGPFGVGRNTLDGKPGNVTLENSDGKYSASTPEQLMEQQLGWSLPVSSLDNWVRGLKAPDSKGEFTYDSKGYPSTLKQDGWTIEYKQWSYADGYWLPGRLRLQYGDITVTFVITQWQPTASQQG